MDVDVDVNVDVCGVASLILETMLLISFSILFKMLVSFGVIRLAMGMLEVE